MCPLTFSGCWWPSALSYFLLFFFFNDTATTEIYTLSLHDALPISTFVDCWTGSSPGFSPLRTRPRSEEHTSELQSPCNLVCRLLLEKKKIEKGTYIHRFYDEGKSTKRNCGKV